MFEIKKEGASLQIPGGYAAATASGGIVAQAVSPATRLVPGHWWIAGCLVGAGAAGALWL